MLHHSAETNACFSAQYSEFVGILHVRSLLGRSLSIHICIVSIGQRSFHRCARSAPMHRELFFLTKLPHNKTSQTRLESWDVLLISPPPRSVQKRGYRRASEEEIARECHSSAQRWGDENGLLYCMIRGCACRKLLLAFKGLLHRPRNNVTCPCPRKTPTRL